MNSYLPLNIRIDNRRILFIGGGRVALHKIENIVLFTKNITVVALEVDDKLKEMGFPIIQKGYDKNDLKGFDLIFAATNNMIINKSIKEDANREGILINVVDNKELSDFISPAVFKKENMVVAVSSGGTNIKQTLSWRNRIRDFLKNG